MLHFIWCIQFYNQKAVRDLMSYSWKYYLVSLIKYTRTENNAYSSLPSVNTEVAIFIYLHTSGNIFFINLWSLLFIIVRKK